MPTPHYFSADAARKIAAYVRRGERRPLNNPPPWRANKITLGNPATIKWGLAPATIDPAIAPLYRIESAPGGVTYGAPGGTYTAISHSSYGHVPNAWIPLDFSAVSTGSAPVVISSIGAHWMFGIFGNLIRQFDPNTGQPTGQDSVHVEGGAGEGMEVPAIITPLASEALRHNVHAYAIWGRASNPASTPAEVFIQPCDEPE
jgi:hypothetical protein